MVAKKRERARRRGEERKWGEEWAETQRQKVRLSEHHTKLDIIGNASGVKIPAN